MHDIVIPHVFLQPKVVRRGRKMDRGRKSYRGNIGRAVRSTFDSVQLTERVYLANMADSTGMHNCTADVVNEPILDELLAVPRGVEYFSDRQRGSGVFAHDSQRVLVLGGGDILQPVHSIRFKGVAQLACLSGRQPMMTVMKQAY